MTYNKGAHCACLWVQPTDGPQHKPSRVGGAEWRGSDNYSASIPLETLPVKIVRQLKNGGPDAIVEVLLDIAPTQTIPPLGL